MEKKLNNTSNYLVNTNILKKQNKKIKLFNFSFFIGILVKKGLKIKSFNILFKILVLLKISSRHLLKKNYYFKIFSFKIAPIKLIKKIIKIILQEVVFVLKYKSGQKYKVPVIIKQEQKYSKTIKHLIYNAQKRKEKNLLLKIYSELINSLWKKSITYKTKQENKLLMYENKQYIYFLKKFSKNWKKKKYKKKIIKNNKMRRKNIEFYRVNSPRLKKEKGLWSLQNPANILGIINPVNKVKYKKTKIKTITKYKHLYKIKHSHKYTSNNINISQDKTNILKKFIIFYKKKLKKNKYIYKYYNLWYIINNKLYLKKIDNYNKIKKKSKLNLKKNIYKSIMEYIKIVLKDNKFIYNLNKTFKLLYKSKTRYFMNYNLLIIKYFNFINFFRKNSKYIVLRWFLLQKYILFILFKLKFFRKDYNRFKNKIKLVNLSIKITKNKNNLLKNAYTTLNKNKNKWNY